MNDKKLLSELTNTEAENLMKVNEFMRKSIYEYAMDCISFDINEIAGCLDKVPYIRYELGNACYGDYIRVNTESYKAFLEAVQELDNNFAILSDDSIYNKVQRMIDKYDFFDDCLSGYIDISDSQLEKLNKWYDNGVNQVIKVILDYVTGLIDYDEFYFMELWLDSAGNEYATDGKYIYELDVKRYA